MKEMPFSERLIVSADFEPNESGNLGVWGRVMSLVESLKGTGVYIKVNSALRDCGYELIDSIHDHGLKVFADLKLNDIPRTLMFDGKLLCPSPPELLTVMCAVGVDAMLTLVGQLPDTEVLGVTVLTSLNGGHTEFLYRCGVSEAVLRLVSLGIAANVGGFVSSAKEAASLRAVMTENETHQTINVAGIRFRDVTVRDDDQNPQRVMTPAEAIKAGADRIIMGRPITQAENPRLMVERALEEIESAL